MYSFPFTSFIYGDTKTCIKANTITLRTETLTAGSLGPWDHLEEGRKPCLALAWPLFQGLQKKKEAPPLMSLFLLHHPQAQLLYFLVIRTPSEVLECQNSD